MKTLFVDFDGTICQDRFWRSLGESEYTQVQEILFQENSEMVVDWMKGAYSSEDITEFLAKKINLDYSYLWETFKNDCDRMKVSLAIFEVLTKLRSKYHLVLITGNMDSFDRFTALALQLHNYFDVMVNSYTEKQLKTDNNGETFLKYVQGSITDAVLVEDSSKSCEVFQKLGGTALQVTPQVSALAHLQYLNTLDE